MKLNLLLKDIEFALKQNKGNYEYFLISEYRESGNITSIGYEPKTKQFSIFHNGNVWETKNKKHAKFVYEWFAGSPDEMNVKTFEGGLIITSKDPEKPVYLPIG